LGPMAIRAGRAERPVPHDFAAVDACGDVACAAIELAVRAVQREPRVPVVIERDLSEALRVFVALRAVGAARDLELSGVHVFVAVRAARALRALPRSPALIGGPQRCVARAAIGASMVPRQREAGPQSVVEARQQRAERALRVATR